MSLPAWLQFRKVPKAPPEPPDPDTVPVEARGAAVQARVDAGLKPWPQRSDLHYFNEVIGICSVCGGKPLVLKETVNVLER